MEIRPNNLLNGLNNFDKMKSDILHKRINGGYISWFEKSNRWIFFRNQAWFIVKELLKNQNKSDVALNCSKKFGESENFWIEIIEQLNIQLKEILKPVEKEYDSDKTEFTGNIKNYFSERYYKLDSKIIKISYGSFLCEYYIHPSLAYLEVISPMEHADCAFQIENSNTKSRLNVNEGSETFMFNDFIKLRKQLNICISNILYQRNINDWLTFVHASAISDGKSAVLLSSDSGSGKSTLAAMLQTRDLEVLADDFVPVGGERPMVFSFPAAISIKQGMHSFIFSFYKKQENTNYIFTNYPRTKVQHLSTKANTFKIRNPLPVKAIVFVKFTNDCNFRFRELKIEEGLLRFHEQAWVSANPEHARTFLNWITTVKFYDLEYSDNEKGMQFIQNLFK